MHPRLAELADDLARHRAAVLAAVASVPADDLERRPAPDTWSVAQLVDHLRVVEAGTARMLARRIERARASGVGADAREGSVRGVMDRFDVVASATKYVAPETVWPRDDVTAEEALEALAASRETLLATLRDADDLDLTQVKATHPAFGELDGYQWIVWLGQHESRHARQIEAVRDQLAGQSAGADG